MRAGRRAWVRMQRGTQIKSDLALLREKARKEASGADNQLAAPMPTEDADQRVARNGILNLRLFTDAIEIQQAVVARLQAAMTAPVTTPQTKGAQIGLQQAEVILSLDGDSPR